MMTGNENRRFMSRARHIPGHIDLVFTCNDSDPGQARIRSLQHLLPEENRERKRQAVSEQFEPSMRKASSSCSFDQLDQFLLARVSDRPDFAW
jgi:hypothetical protein